MRLQVASLLLLLAVCTACSGLPPAPPTGMATAAIRHPARAPALTPPANCPPAPDPATLVVNSGPRLPPPKPAPNVVPGRLLYRPRPDYPDCARLRQVNGIVDVELTVQADGSVSDPKITREVPAGFGFGDAAMAVLPLWKFQPKQVDGVPVPYSAYYRVESRMEEYPRLEVNGPSQ